jgi:hypothetical protein
MDRESGNNDQIVDSAQEIWKLPLQSAGCDHCKQAFLIDSSQIGKTCPNCGAGLLSSQPSRLRSEPPELLIPFQLNQNSLRPVLEKFTKGVWIHTDDFTPDSLMQRCRPIYFPSWLVDCDVEGNWQVEAGYDYQVKSSQEFYSSDRWNSRDVIETRIRWEPRLGQLKRHYDNIASPAASDHQRVLSMVKEYQYNQAVNYSPDPIKGASMRVPDLHPESSWPIAQATLNKNCGADCAQAAGAQHDRNFSINASYSNPNWTQLLLPMYSTHYHDDNGNPQMIFVNGQTGNVGGLRLASQKKGREIAGMLILAAAALFILGLLMTFFAALIIPLSIIGILFIVLSVAAGIFAIVTLAWPWQWNRQQQPPRVSQR